MLFLDELHEFPNKTLAALRQPLEEGAVHILRNSCAAEFPADFLLVGAANPCPCGNYLDQGADVECACTAHELRQYRRKFSGPFTDRIDIQVEMRRMDVEDLAGVIEHRKMITLQDLRAEVERAREWQRRRNGGDGATAILNSQVKEGKLLQLFRLMLNAGDLAGLCRTAAADGTFLPKMLPGTHFGDLDESERSTRPHRRSGTIQTGIGNE